MNDQAVREESGSIVVGAGIVGLCTALYLQDSGRRVTLVDRLPPGEGTSSGNAGILSTGSVHPEAMPGIWKELPGMLLRPLAPVQLRPGYLPRMLPWFLRFLASSRESRAEASSIAINALSCRGLEYFRPLLRKARAEALLSESGSLYVYESAAQYARARSNCAYYSRRGVEHRLIPGPELPALEPGLRPGLAGGILTPGAAHTLSPLALSRSLFNLFLQQGGVFLLGEVKGFARDGRDVTAVRMEGDLLCEELFITAGAYSGSLARQLGSRVPLDTERGYHLHLPQPGISLERPVLFVDRAFAATSMEDGMRLAGTVEFAGLKAAADYSRARVLARHGAHLLPGLNTDTGSPWMGFRPSLPDSVPVISASPRYGNVYFGFGHGHLGLTQAAVTGAMLAALADKKEFPVPDRQYRIDRF